MEQKMKCPYCGRCIGFVQSTDDENSVFSITKSEQKIVGKKQSNDWYWHFKDYPKEKNGLKVFSCFACGGGLTMGYKLTGYDVIGDLYPKENEKLASVIIENGGLVITEYVNKQKNKYECIKRFIERDRLQEMFSKARILIASFRQCQGDSSYRHAMQKAKEYGKLRYVMFNQKTDFDKEIFGLNQDLLNDNAIVLTEKTIKEITG